MKQTLLALFFFSCSTLLLAQSDNSCINCGANGENTTRSSNNNVSNQRLVIYPNPATEFVGVNDDNDQVRRLDFYSLTGRQVKSITIAKGEKYSVSDLQDGVYFARLIDKNNRIVTTQRITKR